MPQYSIEDLAVIGRTPASPRALSDQLWGVLSHSVVARVHVDSCDRETGDYRVVLQGTFELEPSEGEATP